MSIFKKVLFKDTLIYGLTNALFTGLPLLLMPFLVAVMNPEDYGVVDLFRSICMVLVPVLGLSTVQSISRFYYDLNKSQFSIFSSSVIILHFATALGALGLLAIVDMFLNSEYILLSYLAIVFFLFNQITEVLLSIYRVKRYSNRYMIIRLGTVVLDLSLLAILYFLFTQYDWTYRVIPTVLSTLVFGIISMVLLWMSFNIKFQFNKNMLKQAVGFSSPLILHMIAGYVLNVGDRFAITHFLGAKELGNYSVAYQIGMATSFFYTSFNLAWLPTFFEWMKAEKYSSILKVKRIVFLVMPLLSILIILFWIVLSGFIPNLRSYDVDLKTVIVISIAYVILSYYKFNSNYFFYYKNTKKLALITSITAVLCLVGYIVTIPLFGTFGAAVTTLVTFVIMYICVANLKPKSLPKNEEVT